MFPVQHQSGLKLATLVSTRMGYPWPGQGSLLLGKTRTIRAGPMDTSQRLHCMRGRCQAQEALTVDSVRDGCRRPGAGYKYRAQVQVLWLGQDQFDACAYDLAEIESILENFETAFKCKVLAEYIIHLCTKPMSCCLLHDQVSRDSWLHPQ